MKFNSILNRFRAVAILEGWSYLLIFFTMILKYKFNMPTANYIVGMAHGLLFITYVILLMQVVYTRKLGIKELFIGFIVSLIPFGTFYADKKWFRYW